MVERYNPYYRQRANPFQNMDANPTPITLGYKPSVDPAVLQQNLQRADKKFNRAKAMPQSLIAGLNKTTTFDANRNVLADKYDQEIKDIQKTVQEEYNGDWARASDFVLNRVNRLQGYLKQAEQDYKEYKPKLDAIWKAKAQGSETFGGDGLQNIPNKGTIQLDAEGNIIRNPVNDDVQFYNINKGKEQAYKDVSRALNRRIASTGIIIGNKIYNDSNIPVASQGTIGGMSDKEVMQYLTENSIGRAIAQNAINTNDDFKLYAAQQLGIDPSKVAKDDKALNMFANIVAGQTSRQERINQSIMDNNNDSDGSEDDLNNFSFLPDSEVVVGNRTSNAGKYAAEVAGLDNPRKIANVTKEEVEKNKNLEDAYDLKIKKQEELDSELKQHFEGELISADDALTVFKRDNNIVMDNALKAVVLSGGYSDDTKLSEIPERRYNKIKPFIKGTNIKTVGGLWEAIDYNEKLRQAKSGEAGGSGYNTYLADKITNTETDLTSAGEETVTDIPQIIPANSEPGETMVEYLDRYRRIIPDSEQDKLSEDISDWSSGMEVTPYGVRLKLNPKDPFSTDSDVTKKTVNIPIRSLTKGAAMRLATMGGYSTLWKDYYYRPEIGKDVLNAEEYLGEGAKGKLIKIQDTEGDENLYSFMINGKKSKPLSVYDAMEVMYVYNNAPTSNLIYHFNWSKNKQSPSEEREAHRNKLVELKNKQEKSRQLLLEKFE